MSSNNMFKLLFVLLLTITCTSARLDSKRAEWNEWKRSLLAKILNTKSDGSGRRLQGKVKGSKAPKGVKETKAPKGKKAVKATKAPKGNKAVKETKAPKGNKAAKATKAPKGNKGRLVL